MSLSLQGSVRTCKVDQGWANKVQSDRFENPNLLVCPIWDGMDQYGRYVNPDSFYTKAAGCSSAEDRVYVENDQRPKYFEYVTLDAAGINDEIKNSDGNLHVINSAINNQVAKGASNVAGNARIFDSKAQIVGNQFNPNPRDGAAAANAAAREVQSASVGQLSDQRRNAMGM